MKPDQKMAVVKQYQAKSYIVGMCGDGGNDCVALRAAHVGIALSEAEASIVAPFSTGRDKSIQAVVDIVKVGRAVLQTNMNVYNIFVINGLTSITTYYFPKWFLQAGEAELQDWTRTLIIPLVYMWSISNCCHAQEKLAPKPPSASILGIQQVQAILLPQFGFLVAVVILIICCRCIDEGHYTDTEQYRNLILAINNRGGHLFRLADNVGSASIFILSVMHTGSVAFLQCCDSLYRRPAYKSAHMLAVSCAGLIFLLVLQFTGPNIFTCMFRVNCSNDFVVKNHPMYKPFRWLVTVPLHRTCFWAPSGDMWVHPQNYVNRSSGLRLPPGKYTPYVIIEPRNKMAAKYCVQPGQFDERCPSVGQCRPPDPFGFPKGMNPNNVFSTQMKFVLSLVLCFLFIWHLVYFLFLQNRFANRMSRFWQKHFVKDDKDDQVEDPEPLFTDSMFWSVPASFLKDSSLVQKFTRYRDTPSMESWQG